MNWNWFGWVGLAGLLTLVWIVLDPNPVGAIFGVRASYVLVGAMLLSVGGPLVASIRSRLWLLQSLCGLAVVVWFFWTIAD